MLGIDTNVLVPFLLRDDPKQFERAQRLIKRELGSGETVLISLLAMSGRADPQRPPATSRMAPVT
jgi:predicted nucleic acid-binding protein